MNKLIKYTEIITCFPGYIASGLIIPLIVATCYEVFARYVLNNPTIWAYEFGYLLMGFHFLLGGALTLKKQEHIRIDIFYNKLSNKKKAVIDLFFYIIFIIPCLSVLSLKLYQHTEYSFLSGESTGHSAWNPPIWPMHFIMFLSFFILFLQSLAEGFKSILILKGKNNK